MRPGPARTVGDMVRGLGALVGLVVLVVGVPVGLILFVGWPLPSVMPSLGAVGDAMTRDGVSDGTVVKIVACVLWLAWFELAASVVAETAGLVRGRDVRVLPALGVFRGFTAALFASISLLVTSAHAATVPPLRPAAAATASVDAAVRDVHASSPLLAVAARPEVAATPVAAPTASPSDATWTVRPRDTLWGIAEASLGAGVRWAEIRDANVGREVAPGVVFASDTEVLQPGWVLALPAGAAPPGASSVTVQPGDTLSRLAERVYGDRSRWRDLWEANRNRTFGGRSFVDPDVILPGWELAVPAAAGPDPVASPAPAPPAAASPTEASPAAPETPEPPADPPTPTPSVATAPLDTGHLRLPPDGAEDVGIPVVDAATVERPVWAIPAAIAGSALLATGVAGLATSRRRRRLRTMGPDDSLPPVDPDLAATAAAVRLGDDPVGMARVDVALRYLGARVDPDSGGTPRPEVVVRQSSGDIDVLFDRPAVTPTFWRPGTGERWLTLPAVVPIEPLVDGAGRTPSPCPGLVMLGVSDDAELYVDLEALGVVVVDGPPETVMAIGRTIVATLAVSPLADLVHVVTTGVDCYGFANEERVQSVSDPDAALDLSAALSAGVRGALGDGGTHELRRRSPEEPWEPVVAIVLRADLSPQQLADVRRLVASGGVAFVTDAEVPGARYRLRAGDEGGWRLEPIGMVVKPHGLAAAELADLGAVLGDARAAPVAVAPRPHEPVVDTPLSEPEWELMVRLLGPVEVVNRHGVAASFERAKALELVVWLAQHRTRSTRTGARTAMWETDVRDATFANVVSDARRALTTLAAPPGDDEWVGRTYGEHLPLHRLVITDGELLAARLDHARRQRPGDAVATLRAGLEGVHDAPYSGTAWLWPDGEGLPSHLTLLVTNAATLMARACLELGDHEGLFWATGQGMKVLPGHDELVCLRMQAHAAAGNLAGVRNEFESYERVVMGDAWGDGSLSAKVVELRNRLLAPSRVGSQL